MKGLEELGVADKDTGLGEVSSEVIRDVLQGGSSGGVALRFGDVGPDPPHGTGPGKFSIQGRAADHRCTDEEVG